MKFLKKLGTVLLVILVIAGIFGVVIALNWDMFSAMPERMEQMEQEQAEQQQIAEATKEVTELLGLAWEYFENENLVEFEITQIYADTGETADNRLQRNAADRSQGLMRSVNKSADPISGVVWEDYTKIFSKTFAWPDLRESNDTWVLYRQPDTESTAATLYHNGQGHALAYDTWYFYDGWLSDQFGYPNQEMPFGIMTAQVTGYEKVGTEEIRGQMTTHYIVSHAPMMRLPQSIDMQYGHPTNQQLCSPRDYFAAATDPQIIETYPELYEKFMALMESHWYEDNKTHVWLTEDGRLLRIGYDITFDTYEMYFCYGMPQADLEYGLVDISYEEGENGEWVEVKTPSALAQLRPVTRMVDLYYGDEVEPIVLPEGYAVLSEKEAAAYNQQFSQVAAPEAPQAADEP